jgi:hypothetical protein
VDFSLFHFARPFLVENHSGRKFPILAIVKRSRAARPGRAGRRRDAKREASSGKWPYDAAVQTVHRSSRRSWMRSYARKRRRRTFMCFLCLDGVLCPVLRKREQTTRTQERALTAEQRAPDPMVNPRVRSSGSQPELKDEDLWKRNQRRHEKRTRRPRSGPASDLDAPLNWGSRTKAGSALPISIGRGRTSGARRRARAPATVRRVFRTQRTSSGGPCSLEEWRITGLRRKSKDTGVSHLCAS